MSLFERLAELLFPPPPPVVRDSSTEPPVPWIGKEPWELRNDPTSSRSGAYDEVLAGRLQDVELDADDYEPEDVERLRRGLVTPFDMEAKQVSEHQRALMPVLPVDPSLPLPPTGTLAEHQRRIDDETPDVANLPNGGFWPVCCDRLAVLLLVNPYPDQLAEVESAVGPLDHIFWFDLEAPENEAVSQATWIPELEAVRAGGHVDECVNIFHCRACGRLYGGYGHT